MHLSFESFLILLLVLKTIESKKCCPIGSGLLISEADEIVSYECITPVELADIGIEAAYPLFMLDESSEDINGFPESCSSAEYIIEDYHKYTAKNNSCFDKVLHHFTNDTNQNHLASKVVQIKCIQGDEGREVVDDIEMLTKCCAVHQTLDLTTNSCMDGKSKKSISTIIKDQTHFVDLQFQWQCELGNFMRIYSESKFHMSLQNNELLLIDKQNNHKDFLSLGSYCIEASDEDLHVVSCKQEKNCPDDICVKKCCPVGQHYRPRTCKRARRDCVSGFLPFVPDFFEKVDGDYVAVGRPDIFGIEVGITCPYGRFVVNQSLPSDAVYLTKSGELFHEGEAASEAQYCIETTDLRMCGEDIVLDTVLCYAETPPNDDERFFLAFLANCISIVFLTMTLFLYCLVPSLRNVHGLSRMCHVIALLIAFLGLCRIQYAVVSDEAACTFIGYTIYFGLVAAFFWLNIMCFDMWWTFGSLKSQTHKRHRRRFIFYSAYAWGLPVVMCTTMALLDAFPVSSTLDAQIGKRYCWFGSPQNDPSDWPHYIFYVIPVGTLISMNLVLWFLTALHCAKVKSELHRIQAHSGENKAKKRFFSDKAKYMVTLRMLIVMGVCWIFEVLSTIFENPRWLWISVDLLNGLQGFFIFIILVLRPNVLYKLRKKLGLQRNRDDDGARSSTGCRTTTSSAILSRSTEERTMLKNGI